jgi:diguanylate cyclase (GGDEF)-like protein/PAS domain S-box-containing protein
VPGNGGATIDAATGRGRAATPDRTDQPTAATWALAPSGLLAAGAALAACGPTVGRSLAFAATAIGVAAIVVGVARHRPATARAWLLLAFGRGALVVAALESAAGNDVGHLLGAAVGQAATALGLLLLARHATRVWDRSRWIDAVVVSASAGATALGLLLATTDGPFVERWLLPLVPAVGLLLVLLATRSLLAVRDRGTSIRLLVLALGVQWIGEVVAGWVPTGADVAAATILTATALATLLMGLAALHPSIAEPPNRALPWRRMGPVRFAVLVTAVLAPLLALAGLSLADALEADAVVVLATGTALLAVLVLVRVTGLVSYADALADERHRSRFEALADHAHDAVAIIDADERIAWASPAVRTVLGPAPETVMEQPLDALVGPSTARDLRPSLAKLAQLPTGATMEVHATITDAEGHERSIEGTATNLQAEPSVEGIVLVVRDVTERVAMQRQLVEQAFVDPLTGLANRALFIDRVGHALARPRTTDDGLAVLFIDLDDFKAVNDSLGHGRGDDLLAAVGRRVTEALDPGDTAARLGGDEFAVLLEDTDGPRTLAVAEQILELLAVPLAIGDLALTISASIGVAFADASTDSASILLRNADLAMYESKRDGKGQVRAFRAELHERELQQLTFRTELQAALEQGQLHLLYQPIVDMETEHVTGAEALLRWVHPDRGPISPLEFIPVAESSRAIVPIGRWVLRTACEQLASWPSELGPLTMDVNVSAVQLLDPGFVSDVRQILHDTGVEPNRVVLELTESILVHDATSAREVLEALRELGVRLAIDDFGTGYSSLAYLQNFPIDIVKIDRAFVNQLGESGRGRSLARSIIAIAGSLGIATIAEGVETSAQAADLAALDCEHGQGFHWSRPIDADAFAALAATIGSSPASPHPSTSPALA